MLLYFEVFSITRTCLCWVTTFRYTIHCSIHCLLLLEICVLRFDTQNIFMLVVCLGFCMKMLIFNMVGHCFAFVCISYNLNSFFFFFSCWSHFYFPASGQAVVSGVAPSPPPYVPSVFIAHRVQHSRCSSTFFRRMLLTHAFALSASQFVHKKKSNACEYALVGTRTHEIDL